MPKPPKYGFHLTEDGVLRIVKTDGSPITPEDVEWYKSTVRDKLRADTLAMTANHIRSAQLNEQPVPVEGVTRGGVRFEVDPAIVELERIRDAQGHTKASVAKAMFVGNTSQLTDWVRGASRPHMFNLRAWAAVLGRTIMLVPSSLAPSVRQVITEWEEANEKGSEAA